jgi:hypothetical protein
MKYYEAIKEEIMRLYVANFLKRCRYTEWVSNIISMETKNGKLTIYIDFRNLIRTTPKKKNGKLRIYIYWQRVGRQWRLSRGGRRWRKGNDS